MGTGEVMPPYVHPDEILFTAYYPTELKPEVWYTILAYAHVASAQEAVMMDSQTRLPDAKGQRKGRAVAMQTIARGTEIVVVPDRRFRGAAVSWRYR